MVCLAVGRSFAFPLRTSEPARNIFLSQHHCKDIRGDFNQSSTVRESTLAPRIRRRQLPHPTPDPPHHSPPLDDVQPCTTLL